VSDILYGECHYNGGVERWRVVQIIQRWVCLTERLCALYVSHDSWCGTVVRF
jgi:hypothetical protein